MRSGGFRLHRLDHASPSSCALYKMSQATWIAERLLGMKSPIGCAASRGTAVEAGIVHGLQNPAASLQSCQDEALRVFDRLTALSPDPRRQKEREAVPGIVEQGVNELRLYGEPSGYQIKVVHKLDGLDVPFIGYLDVVWDKVGVTLDIKSTLKLPNEPSDSHQAQVSLYVHKTNHQGRVGYFSPTKRGVYVVEDPVAHLAELVNVAQRMDRFLAISADPLELASLVVADFDHFTLKDPTAQRNARAVFGGLRSASAGASTPTTLEASAA